MSLSPQFRKYIHPVLKQLDFEKFDIWWRHTNDENWLTQIEITSSKFGNEGLYHVTCDIGFFSKELDELMGWGRQAGFGKDSKFTMPNGMPGCHIYMSSFDLGDDAEWIGYQDNVFLPKGEACKFEVMNIASRLERLMRRGFERYASYESLIDCKRKKIGQEAQSKQASMYAAAACIKLERYDEAREFLEDAVRPGSTRFMKDVGARLSKIVEMSE